MKATTLVKLKAQAPQSARPYPQVIQSIGKKKAPL